MKEENADLPYAIAVGLLIFPEVFIRCCIAILKDRNKLKMKGKSIDWKDVGGEEINLIVTNEKRKEILKKIGYSVDDEGYLVDKNTGNKITAEDGLYINVNNHKKMALVAGTHNFVRNIAGFSQHLANNNTLNIKEK